MAARNGFPVRAGLICPPSTASRFLARFTAYFFARALNRLFMRVDDRMLLSLIKELLIATSADGCLICDMEMLFVAVDGVLVRAKEKNIVVTANDTLLMYAIDMNPMIADGMLLMCAARETLAKVTVLR